MLDYNKQLKQHRKKHGTTYTLPDGQQVRLKPEQLPEYLKKHGLKLKQPKQQATSLEESQVSIK